MFQADLHTHTLASSHAYSTIDEYVREAGQCGIKLFAVTDHAPSLPDSPHIWHFMNLKMLPRVLNGVIVLRGIEENISPSGLDCTDSVLKSLDIVLAGFHAFSQWDYGIDDNTRFLIDTIKSGLVQVISHPCNPAYPIHIAPVVKAAFEHNVALEVNNASFVYTRKGSLDNCRKIIAAVKESGGFLSVASDSHHCQGLGRFAESLELINNLQFPEDRIINTTAVNTINWLKKYHAKVFPALPGCPL